MAGFRRLGRTASGRAGVQVSWVPNADEVAAKLITPAWASAAQDAWAYAMDLVPVDTGYLRSTINVEVLEDPATRMRTTLRAEAEYAAFVEYGTSRMGAQPFLRPAIERAYSRLVQ